MYKLQIEFLKLCVSTVFVSLGKKKSLANPPGQQMLQTGQFISELETNQQVSQSTGRLTARPFMSLLQHNLLRCQLSLSTAEAEKHHMTDNAAASDELGEELRTRRTNDSLSLSLSVLPGFDFLRRSRELYWCRQKTHTRRLLNCVTEHP